MLFGCLVEDHLEQIQVLQLFLLQLPQPGVELLELRPKRLDPFRLSGIDAPDDSPQHVGLGKHFLQPLRHAFLRLLLADAVGAAHAAALAPEVRAGVVRPHDGAAVLPPVLRDARRHGPAALGATDDARQQKLPVEPLDGCGGISAPERLHPFPKVL